MLSRTPFAARHHSRLYKRYNFSSTYFIDVTFVFRCDTGVARCLLAHRCADVQESLRHARAMMVSPPDSIAILQQLLRLTSANTAIEVGCFTGQFLTHPLLSICRTACWF